MHSFFGIGLEYGFDFVIRGQGEYFIGIEVVLGQHGSDGGRFIEAAAVNPQRFEQAVDERQKTLGVAQLHASDSTHQHEGVDREMRIELQWHAITFGEAVEVLKHVMTLGWNSRRGSITGGFEDPAKQDRDVEELAVGLLTDLG
ncbi:hypothetical protein D3C85_1357970 [compost metagenome]